MIINKFFDFYKNARWFIKILLFAVLLIFAILWVIGSLAYIDRCVMFIIGIIIGVVLMYFFYPYITEWINTIIDYIVNIF